MGFPIPIRRVERRVVLKKKVLAEKGGNGLVSLGEGLIPSGSCVSTATSYDANVKVKHWLGVAMEAEARWGWIVLMLGCQEAADASNGWRGVGVFGGR